MEPTKSEKIVLNEQDFEQVQQIVNVQKADNEEFQQAAEKVFEAHSDTFAKLADNPSAPEEVLDTRSAEEQEAAMLKQAQDDAMKMAENRDPAEIAAMCFHMFFPRFQQEVMFLSNKELRRLVNALIGKGHVSMPNEPTFKDARTGMAYKIGMELLSAKFMMITRNEMNLIQKNVDAQEAAKAAADAAVIETSYGEPANES